LEVFPVQLAFVGQHTEESVQAPIVENRPIEMLVPILMLLHHHLPLGKIADHNSTFNQFVAYEMRSLV
jgi:hypothetical protein